MVFDNISCIIGTNGFGKTSILNSIKLCLGESNIDINSILNNNAQEKKCWVELDFEEFKIKRSWDFTSKLEESVSVTFRGGEKLEDSEADHFIQNKIPYFLVDFLFYDGEIGNNFLLLSNTKLKSIFDYIFDLDLLVNTQKDSLVVAKRLLERNSDESTNELLELENQRLEILDLLTKQKEEFIEKERDLKSLKMNLQKLNTQIKNRNKKSKALYEEREQIERNLEDKAKSLKKIILWEMPLLLNKNLLKGIEKKNSTALKIEDQSLFSNKFSKFVKELNSSLEENKILELFKSLMITSSNEIELSMSRDDLRKLFEEMKQLKLQINQVDLRLKELQDSIMEQEIMKSLVESKEEQEKAINSDENALRELEDSIEQNGIKAKELNRTLTQAFKQNQQKYAFIKGYEELQIIAKTSAKVYAKKLDKKLEFFNAKLKSNTNEFLKQYGHIKNIFIDRNHKIIITDEKDSKLNTELLSAGQKQVLNFLIVKTILEFKEFASFVMVDTPFGRLSNKNKELLLHSCYLSFENLVLLLTDSEYEFVKSQNIRYRTYQIQRDMVGSKIEEIL